MRIHATICDENRHIEFVDGSSVTVPGLAVSGAELFRRQSLGLPMGVGVHGVTNIPEGMSFEQARFEALRYIAMNKKAAEVPPVPSEPASPPVE